MIFKKLRDRLYKTCDIELKLRCLIGGSVVFGSPEKDVIFSNDMLANVEYGLCLENIVEQLYEYDIAVDASYCDLLKEITQMMNIPESEYSYIRELLPKTWNKDHLI